MTRYDPFAYGQVKLGAGQNGPAADPDDMLFADPEPVRQAQAADSSWALLNEDVGGLLPGSPPEAFAAAAAEFGSDILGEERAPQTQAPKPSAPKPRSEPVPRTRAAASGARGGPVPTMSPAAPAAPAVAAPTRPAAAPVRMASPARMAPMSGKKQRSRGTIAVVAPLSVLAVGGCGAAWLFVMQENPIMGTIVGVSTCVATLFARLLLRD